MYKLSLVPEAHCCHEADDWPRRRPNPNLRSPPKTWPIGPLWGGSARRSMGRAGISPTTAPSATRSAASRWAIIRASFCWGFSARWRARCAGWCRRARAKTRPGPDSRPRTRFNPQNPSSPFPVPNTLGWRPVPNATRADRIRLHRRREMRDAQSCKALADAGCLASIRDRLEAWPTLPAAPRFDKRGCNRCHRHDDELTASFIGGNLPPPAR